MALSYKRMNEKVFVIFDGGVHAAEIVGVNSNNRGVVTGYKIRFPAIDSHQIGTMTMPLVTDSPKANVFTDEEAAGKALFTRKLKGEIA